MTMSDARVPLVPLVPSVPLVPRTERNGGLTWVLPAEHPSEGK